MDREAFVEGIRIVVLEPAVTETMSVLSQPPGKAPDPSLLNLSRWFATLAADDRIRLRQVVQMAAHRAVFGFLAVLDGVRAIDSERGTLELRYRSAHQDLSLNDDDGAPLHDVL